MLNPTISAPPPFRNVLRENSRSCSRPVISLPTLRHRSSSLLDRRQNPRIGPTAAQVAVHRRPDLIFGRILRRREQISSLDHHPVLAVTTMRHLHVDPRLL